MATHKYTHSYGVYDAYKWIRKHKWFNIGRPLTEKEFYSIIRTIGTIQKEELSKFEEIVFPYNMGKLSPQYVPTYVKIINGKLKTNRRIDWSATKKNHFRVYKENEYYIYNKYIKGKFVNREFVTL